MGLSRGPDDGWGATCMSLRTATRSIHQPLLMHTQNVLLTAAQWSTRTSRQMRHRYIVSFLFVRGLTAMLLVGGLGVPRPKPRLQNELKQQQRALRRCFSLLVTLFGLFLSSGLQKRVQNSGA